MSVIVMASFVSKFINCRLWVLILLWPWLIIAVRVGVVCSTPVDQCASRAALTNYGCKVGVVGVVCSAPVDQCASLNWASTDTTFSSIQTVLRVVLCLPCSGGTHNTHTRRSHRSHSNIATLGRSCRCSRHKTTCAPEHQRAGRHHVLWPHNCHGQTCVALCGFSLALCKLSQTFSLFCFTYFHLI